MSEDPASVEGSSPARAGEAPRALIRRTRKSPSLSEALIIRKLRVQF
jgi:hypothetical protein